MSWTSPRTWAAGEIEDAAMFNSNVRDNLAWLAKDPAGWTTVASIGGFANGWSDYDTGGTYGPLRFRHVGPWTCVVGLAKGTVGVVSVSEVTAFSLPSSVANIDRDSEFPAASSQATPFKFHLTQGFTDGTTVTFGSGVNFNVINIHGVSVTFAWFSFACMFPTNPSTD